MSDWDDECKKCGAKVPDTQELIGVSVSMNPADPEANDGGATVTEYMLLCDQCELEMVGVR